MVFSQDLRMKNTCTVNYNLLDDTIHYFNVSHNIFYINVTPPNLPFQKKFIFPRINVLKHLLLTDLYKFKKPKPNTVPHKFYQLPYLNIRKVFLEQFYHIPCNRYFTLIIKMLLFTGYTCCVNPSPMHDIYITGYN